MAQYCSAEVWGRKYSGGWSIVFDGITAMTLAGDLLDNNGAETIAELAIYLRWRLEDCGFPGVPGGVGAFFNLLVNIG